MRILIILASLMCALACTSVKTTVDPDSSVDQPIDSCQAFWERYSKYMNPMPDIDSAYFVTGEWAETSIEDPAAYNISVDFFYHKKCFIGKTEEEIIQLLGKPSWIEIRRDEKRKYEYIYIVMPEGATTYHRYGKIHVYLISDTVSRVTPFSESIHIR